MEVLSLSSTTSTVASKNLCFHVLHNIKVQHPLLMLCDNDCIFFTFITIEYVMYIMLCITSWNPTPFSSVNSNSTFFSIFSNVRIIYLCEIKMSLETTLHFLGFVLYEIHLFESECRPPSVRGSGAGDTQVL